MKREAQTYQRPMARFQPTDSNSSSRLGPVVASSWRPRSHGRGLFLFAAVPRSPPGPEGSPMAVPGAAARRLLALAPASSRRAFWSASWAADPAAPSASSTSPENSSSRKKKAPSGSTPHRIAAVMDAVNERKLPPELRGRGNAVRSETDIVNVVEQRIWHSMEEGHFENLPGKGKPLNLTSNPHADPAEDTLYRILSRNGCAPEWVELNKEIRGMIMGWRSALRKAWTNRSEDDGSNWNDDCRVLQEQIRQINDKVFRHNLIVPFGRQMFGLNWDKEVDKLK